MDQTTKDKLAVNVANSWKMYSVRFVGIFSIGASAAVGWFNGLPADCAPLLAAHPPVACSMSQASFLGQFGIGLAVVPLIAGALAWWARVHPQPGLSPAVAEAKSTTVGPAEVAAGAPPPSGS